MLLKKIVVAEDDDAIAHLITMALGDAGFLCIRARDGSEALSLVRVHAPDLLVLDVMMPRLDGREVAKRVKADVILSKTPILMLTAMSSIDDKLAGFDAGADDYLAKPFDLREFSARVHALIRAARRERDRSPTTNRPGAGAIDDHLAVVLKQAEPRAVLHIDVRGYDAWADQVGYAEAEKLAAALGRLVLGSARGHEAEFVGHLGGVDFIVVAALADAEPFAKDAIHAFERDRISWGADRAETLSLVVAGITTAGLGNEVELSSRLGAAMQSAKQGEGSRYVVAGPDQP
jgi:DNA-binding response OmpR family regulator